MNFKIGMISKMTGMSASGIRFLEEKGLIRPSGGRKGTYRSYGMEDVSTILDYRNNRSCGLTQDEILRIHAGASPKECEMLFNGHCENLEKELQEKMRLLRHMRERCRDISLLGWADQVCEITERPAMILLPLTKDPPTPFRWPEEIGFDIPYSDSALMMSSGVLLKNADDWDTEVGLGMLEYEAQRCGFLGCPDVKYYPKHKAVRMIAEIGKEMIPTTEERNRIMSRIRKLCEQGVIRLDKELPILTKRILTTTVNGRTVRYDNLWIDIL